MNDQIERIIKAAANNGVTLNKNFNVTYLSTHGFYDGPKFLAEKSVNEMEKFLKYGVNCGFDGTLKNALDKLSDIVVSLTAVKNGDVRELSKIEVQRNKILETVKDSAYPVYNDMRASVEKYIESSVEAIDTIISLNKEGEIFSTVDKRQIELMEESKVKLGELSASLYSVMDLTSVKAKENAEKIIEYLKKWRRDGSRFMCTSVSLRYLDEAKAVADEWKNILITPSKKERAKDEPEYKRDEMSIIASSRGGLETLSVFNARIQTRLAEIDKMQGELSADKAEVSKLKGELADLEQKKKEVAIEFKNTGNTVKANSDIAAIRQRAEEISSEIKSLEGNGRLVKKEKDIKNRREIALHIKHICDTLTDNKSDLVFLARVIQNVDFNSLVGVMTGRSHDMEEARESILQIRVRVDNLRQAFTDNAAILNDEEEMTDSILGEDLFEEETLEKETNENGLDAELAALLQEFDKEEVKEEEKESEDIRRIIPLGDDDK